MAEFKNRKNSSKKYRVFDKDRTMIGEVKRYCGPGKTWVPGFRREDGTYVKGHCREIGDKKEWNPVQRTTKKIYRVGIPPFEKSTEIVEIHNDDVTKDSGEDENSLVEGNK